jgi:large subunit ribosomal protein L21
LRHHQSQQQQQQQQRQNRTIFAAVDHSVAYETAMKGQHGMQLELAALEGVGKDDADFDPFIEEEMEEDRIRAGGKKKEEKDGKKEYDEHTLEGEIIGQSDADDDDLDDLEDADEISLSAVYNNDGSLKRAKLASLRAGAPAGGMIAIIELAGTQYKVTTDDVLIVNRLKPLDSFAVGSVHELETVMLCSSSHLTLVGMPYVTGATVVVMVEEITMDEKVIIFKKRRRKHSQRKNGFRRDVTMLRILDIRPPEQYQEHEHVERPSPTLPA